MAEDPTWRFELEAESRGYRWTAGLDEVGRGCLAGPVVAAAVILDRDRPVDGIRDSKLLSPARREEIAAAIGERAVGIGVGMAASTEIDAVNILRATQAAMVRAVQALGPGVDYLLIDAVKLPETGLPQLSMVRGDRLCMSIAAASVVAKVVRDRLMQYYGKLFPGFGFEANKGYGTAGHMEAIGAIGPSPIHRRTFRGVWDQLPLAFSG